MLEDLRTNKIGLITCLKNSNVSGAFLRFGGNVGFFFFPEKYGIGVIWSESGSQKAFAQDATCEQ